MVPRLNRLEISVHFGAFGIFSELVWSKAQKTFGVNQAEKVLHHHTKENEEVKFLYNRKYLFPYFSQSTFLSYR